jgi:chromosome partitioning protein
MMKRIIVLNAKGGCGKSTVATNLASRFAVRGFSTALIDYDPQGSSLQWLKFRPPGVPPIHGVAAHDSSRTPLSGAWQMRVPRETRRVIVDTQAGIRAMDLVGRITPTDTLLIPIQPSAVDIRATADFIRDLLLVAKLRPQDRQVAIVGNRTRRNTNSLATLQRFLDSLRIPVLAHLRDSQNYALAAEQGIGVCELPPVQARAERPSWDAIFNWIEPESGDSVPVAHQPATSRLPEEKPVAPVPAFLTQGWDAGTTPQTTVTGDIKRLN